MNDQLLPANATDLERNLADARSKEPLLENRLSRLINIDAAPDNFQNSLAIQHSVDYWLDEWGSELKRSVLKQSYFRHRIKGTPAAVKKSLEPFGYVPTITEWFDVNPQMIPGTFRLEIDLGGKALSEEVYKEVNRLVNENKPASRHMAGLQFTSTLVVPVRVAVVHQDAITFELFPG